MAAVIFGDMYSGDFVVMSVNAATGSPKFTTEFSQADVLTKSVPTGPQKWVVNTYFSQCGLDIIFYPRNLDARFT